MSNCSTAVTLKQIVGVNKPRYSSTRSGASWTRHKSEAHEKLQAAFSAVLLDICIAAKLRHCKVGSATAQISATDAFTCPPQSFFAQHMCTSCPQSPMPVQPHARRQVRFRIS
eukprot:1158962-Pelagomonas_calceolata.AAC.2